MLVNEFGSNDDTVSIALSFGDSRLRVLQNETRLGLANSLNLGIREASGEYIARADAGDLYPLDRFRKQVEFMDKHPKVAVVGSWQRHFGRYDLIHKPPESHEELKASFLFNCNICHSTLMLRKKAFVEHNLWYDNRFLAEDYELWCRAVWKTRFYTIQEVLGEYRVGDDQITEQKKDGLEIEHRAIVARTLRERLRITVPDKDLILCSGWTNPFADTTRADRNDIIGREKELLAKIKEQNKKLHAYDQKALERVVDNRRAWATSNGFVSPMVSSEKSRGFKTWLKRIFVKMIHPFYVPIYRKIIQPISDIQKQLSELRRLMDTRDWKNEQVDEPPARYQRIDLLAREVGQIKRALERQQELLLQISEALRGRQ
jgi:glycosyltransferase involved in cell wall biosynthesis